MGIIKRKILNKKESNDQSVKTQSLQRFHQYLEVVIRSKKRKKRRKKIKNEEDHRHYPSYYHLDQRLRPIMLQRMTMSMKRLNKIRVLNKKKNMRMKNRNHCQMNIRMMMK